ncbi:hypothetical protein C7M84_011238 [Penaeus vannamei]|uniref:Ig-like domain-containing protein n=1 Tax=Penaeus vannamei TaxID=6689 RepID=A0A423T2J3_PENVA|nr:hypothetical protein C7M84_011238 [Penaeus vannamei]
MSPKGKRARRADPRKRELALLLVPGGEQEARGAIQASAKKAVWREMECGRQEQFRNEQRVTLSLTRLSVSASGQYRCEVIAEHPSFRTEASTAKMIVLREPLKAPVLVGAREIYEPTELIKIGCQTRQPFLQEHLPTLKWYLNDNKSPSHFVFPLPLRAVSTFPSLSPPSLYFVYSAVRHSGQATGGHVDKSSNSQIQAAVLPFPLTDSNHSRCPANTSCSTRVYTQGTIQ